MLHIDVTKDHEFSITYYMEGVKCTEVLTTDLWLAREEVVTKLRLMMGLAKGKTLTSIPERLKS